MNIDDVSQAAVAVTARQAIPPSRVYLSAVEYNSHTGKNRTDITALFDWA